MQLSTYFAFLVLLTPLVSAAALPRPYDPYLDDPVFRKMLDEAAAADIATSFDDVPLNATDTSLHRREEKKELTCETSKASAPIHEIHLAANILIADHKWDDRCTQDTMYGSKCTKFREVGYASISMCGNHARGIKCHTIAWAAKHIAESCKKNGRAGGKYQFYSAHDLVVTVH